MAKLIKLSDTSWRQPFADRKKEFHLWNSHPEVATFCKLEDGTKRLLNIKFEEKFKIDITDNFQITSGKEISFPKDLRDKIEKIILKNPESYFIVTVLDCNNVLLVPSNIRWLKNVKRNQGEGWAYDDITFDKPFLLNWPTSKRNSAATPKVDDIILLFQKPNKINGKKNYNVQLTHLVSPISEPIILDNNNPKHKWCREVKLIAMANPIEGIPNQGYFNFFLANRGLTNPIVNLENKLGLSVSETQEQIWDLFQNYFGGSFSDQLPKYGNPVEEILGEVEGDKVIREHIRQELTRRNASIVQRAKEEALKKGNGRILCDCCGFDFIEIYGSHGTGFIECHHKIHIADGQRITTTADLALVCSNCHRMLHRKNEKGKYYKVKELIKLILNGKKSKFK